VAYSRKLQGTTQ